MMALLHRVVTEEGSTRALGLMRIGLVLLLWVRWGSSLALFRAEDVPTLATALLFFCATTFALVGLATRLSMWLSAVAVGLVVFYVDLVRHQEAHHHTTLLFIGCVLLALSPCGRSFSVDRHRALRRAASNDAKPPAERGPLWAQRLIGLQVSSVYFWSAVDKSSWAWVSGMRLQMIYMEQYTDYAWPSWPGFTAVMALGAVASLALEYALAIGLWWPKARRWLIPVGLAFHAVIFVTLPVSTFSVTMAVLYLAFLTPDAVHRAVDALVGAEAPRSPRPKQADARATPAAHRSGAHPPAPPCGGRSPSDTTAP